MFAKCVRWHVNALGRNPLVRTSDRFEALAVLAALIIALFAVPAAAHAGTQIYGAGVRTATEQAHVRHSVDAVAVDGSTSIPSDYESSAYVHAQWHEGTRLRTEQIITPATVKAGEPLQIWLDDTGRVVAEPLTTDDALLSAVVAGVGVWVAVAACTALLTYAIRRALDRSRDHAWARELHLLANNDDGWANRHI